MMAVGEAKPVTVHILDKEFRVACPDDERQALMESAQLLDRNMRDIRDRGKAVGLDRIAVMAALNITHELLQMRSGQSEDTRSLQARIRYLQDKIEDALNKGRQIEL